VISALDQLAAEGLLESRRGSGIQVARLGGASRPKRDGGLAACATPSLSPRGTLMASQPRVRTMPRRTAFHPGTPDLAEFPFKTWSRLLTRHARFGAADLFGYHYMSGYPGLRRVIAGFLNTMRRVRCGPEQIVVTTGGQAALDLLPPASSTGRHGRSVGYPGARGAFRGAARAAAGRATAAAPPLADRRRASSIDPIVPASARRDDVEQLAILATARRQRRVNKTTSTANTPSGAQAAAGHGASTTNPRTTSGRSRRRSSGDALKPPLPGDLAERIKPAISLTGQFAPMVLQATLADFIEEGSFFLHLNRMRRLYGRRRDHFLGLTHGLLDRWLDPIDGRTGIQIAAPFRLPMDDTAVVAAAAAAGINLAPLSLYHHHQPRQAGLMMGYAAVPEAEMDRLFPQIRSILAAVAPD
jgi:GntR family transcriptional regulator/MocR family aminotransferase